MWQKHYDNFCKRVAPQIKSILGGCISFSLAQSSFFSLSRKVPVLVRHPLPLIHETKTIIQDDNWRVICKPEDPRESEKLEALLAVNLTNPYIFHVILYSIFLKIYSCLSFVKFLCGLRVCLLEILSVYFQLVQNFWTKINCKDMNLQEMNVTVEYLSHNITENKI